MAARFAGRDPVRPAALRAEALRLAEVELHAYEPVLKAPPEEREAALSAAAESPLAIARAAAEVAALGAELAREGRESLKGDALTGAILAEAACRAAVTLVRINLAGAPGDPRLAEAAKLVERASANVP